jgi:hypothetical protein
MRLPARALRASLRAALEPCARRARRLRVARGAGVLLRGRAGDRGRAAPGRPRPAVLVVRLNRRAAPGPRPRPAVLAWGLGRRAAPGPSAAACCAGMGPGQMRCAALLPCDLLCWWCTRADAPHPGPRTRPAVLAWGPGRRAPLRLSAVTCCAWAASGPWADVKPKPGVLESNVSLAACARLPCAKLCVRVARARKGCAVDA